MAAIAYLDGEKHVRVSMAMDAIMKYVSEQKANTSLMYMCTPTDVYAVPEEVVQASQSKYQQLSKLESTLTKGISLISRKHFSRRMSRICLRLATSPMVFATVWSLSKVKLCTG